jgi:tetratricopeptide (TPR) repeat protein
MVRLALPLVRTLREHYAAAGRPGEWQELRTELMEQVGAAGHPAAGHDRTGLWLFLQGSAAGDALARSDLDRAERIYRHILEVLPAWQGPQAEPYRGVACHQLGLIATERRQLDQAEQWYRRALDTFLHLGLERSAADEYLQLGGLAQERQQLDQAEQLYRQALAIYDRRNLPVYAVAVCLQLGRLAEARLQRDRAEPWYQHALALCEGTEQHLLLFNSWLQLGGLRERQERLPEAVACSGRALSVATAHPPLLGRPALLQLARLLQAMGEEGFVAAWHADLPGEPPLEALRAETTP